MKRPLRKILILVAALGVAALIVYAFLPKPIPADIVQVTRGELLATVDEDGKTRIKKWSHLYKNGPYYLKEPYRYVFSAPLDGYLEQIQLEAGDVVEAGQVVAVLRPKPPELLDPRKVAELQERKNAAQAARDKAKAQLQEAKKSYDLAHQKLLRARLLPKESISPEGFDIIQNEELVAQERMNVAKMAVKVATYEINVIDKSLLHVTSIKNADSENRLFKITTPMGGKVLRVEKEFKGPVTSGTELLEIGDTHQLEVVIDVLSEDAVKVKEGARVFLEQWGGKQPLMGRVRRVEPGGFLKVSALGVEEQRVNIIVDFDEEENRKIDPQNMRKQLGDAYRVQARIVIWEGKDVIKVPAGALFRDGKKWAVFAVHDGRAQLRYVQAGHSNGLETEILAGLQPGEEVILHPSDQIKDGVQVYGRY